MGRSRPMGDTPVTGDTTVTDDTVTDNTGPCHGYFAVISRSFNDYFNVIKTSFKRV